MGMGNYSNGFREGVMIRGAGMFDAGFGRVWYVDAKTGHGADGNSGKRRDRPFLTMAKALANVNSGDYIVFRGKVREQLTAPDGVFDVTIIGASNRPRHADDHTETGGKRGSSGATWVLPASPVADTPLLRIRNQGWRLANFLMGATTSQVCVDLVTNSESGDAEYSSGHFSCYGMRFDGAGVGIRDNGPGGFVGIYDSFFRGMTTGIGQVAGAGPGTRSWWEIKNNRFSDNTNGIAAILIRSVISHNMFLPTHTVEINLPTGSSNNIVTENVFTGDYDANVAGTGDMWFNNYTLDAASGEADDTTGQTTAVPAA